MTGEQLGLVDVEPSGPSLTARQQAVVDALRSAGVDGLHADEAGAILHELKKGGTRWGHRRGDRCEFCGRDGQTMLRRLRDLGLARYRRGTRGAPGFWQATGAKAPLPPPPDHYNEFPEGF